MVMMALAGASRIFQLMDEKPEDDGGSVTLVNVELGEDGRTMTEAGPRGNRPLGLEVLGRRRRQPVPETRAVAEPEGRGSGE